MNFAFRKQLNVQYLDDSLRNQMRPVMGQHIKMKMTCTQSFGTPRMRLDIRTFSPTPASVLKRTTCLEVCARSSANNLAHDGHPTMLNYWRTSPYNSAEVAEWTTCKSPTDLVVCI